MALAASAALAVAPLATVAQSSPAPTGPAASPVTVTDANGKPVVISDTSRVVSLGGPITEVVYALGAQDDLVGVDASSTFPAQALTDKANVGYYRFLTPEPVLAANPSLILTNAQAGPADVMSQIEATGVTTLVLPVDNSVDGAKAKITAIGQALGKDAEAAALVTKLESDLAAATTLVGTATSKPSVMFVLVAGPGTVLVAGSGTEAQTMIEMAGGTNAVTGYPGYVPLTPEAALAAKPDIILTMDSGLQGVGGVDGFLAPAGSRPDPCRPGQARRLARGPAAAGLRAAPWTGRG